ncbi:MAG: HesA/MoeB/ThiF family protein [Pseudomonadota bacterium]
MADLARYARQIVLPEIGVAGQTALCDSRVLVVGLGGLGCPAARYLAGAGIGTLWLADRDRVERSNLPRQTLYTEADVGKLKVDAAIQHLASVDAGVKLQSLHTAEATLAALREVDVVLDCTDNFETRFALNAACVAARVPLVSGAAIRWEGQVAAFDLRRGGPCYACLYPDTGAAAEACEDAGILGPIVGMVGALQALLALQLLLGQPDVAGQLHFWNARAGNWRKLKLIRDPQCPHCT